MAVAARQRSMCSPKDRTTACIARNVFCSENPRTGKIIAEKLVRYIEDKIKAKDAMIEKLRLKNVTLRNQIHKVITTLVLRFPIHRPRFVVTLPSAFPFPAGVASQLQGGAGRRASLH